MEQKKHIDRLFQEKFKDFEISPDDAVWDKIEETLQKDKRKRRVIPFWWKLGGVAALIALLFTVGRLSIGNFSPQNQPDNTPIVDTNVDSISTDKVNPTVASPESTTTSVSESDTSKHKRGKSTLSNTTQPSEMVVTNSQKKRKPLDKNSNIHSEKQQQNTSAQQAHRKEQLAQHSVHSKTNATAEAIAKNSTSIASQEDKSQKHKSPSATDKTSSEVDEDEHSANAIEEAVAENTSKEDEETDEELDEENQFSKWRISPNVAPVVFSSLGKGSPIDQQFVLNSKSSDIHMSYGLTGSYAFNSRLKVRVGINKVDLNQNTNDVLLYSDANSPTSIRIENVSGNSTSSIMSAQSISNVNSFESIKVETHNTIDQQFGFIEVPVEIEYSIINKRIGVNLIGGFSSLFLNKNDIYVVSENNQRIRIGKANNIEDTSFSANLGLGLNYNLSTSFDINLEPMFKYQINTFSNTSGDFNPYFIGVYTGLSFKF